jgi:hypothetical protein
MIESAFNVQRLGNSPDSRYRVFLEAACPEPIVMESEHFELIFKEAAKAGVPEIFRRGFDEDGRFSTRLSLDPHQVFVIQALMQSCAVR